MTTNEKIQRAKDDLDNAYEAGKKSEYDWFWDGIQNYGKRTSTDNMFLWWQHEEINPKYPLPPVETLQQTFYHCTNIKKHPKLSLLGTEVFLYSAFLGCVNLEAVELECVGTQSRSNCFYRTFWQCNKCVRITKVVPAEIHIFDGTFTGCTSLVDVTFDGVIGNNINFQDCPLSVDSMISIITHLKNFLGTGEERTRTLYFNQDCWNRLEAAGIPTPNGAPAWVDYVNDVLSWNT